ncbi:MULTISPECIES: DUF1090 domain-containing protein [Bordetella]|uniref:DUF1090 domain-containing protein n=1 Tax=Bordetella TaxID=517 RepID=UPI00081CC660|nr:MULTISPECIES: DUF1090 domain-containing protein [Bordetella]AOB27478.1 hypothetical protein BBB44_15100 [Bordetella bronchiseptica]ARP77204.1 hypothetical protein CAL11_14120 [Bordetella genomosp. 6]AZW44793.1 DUF1090 domain-containing protein [Bordetella bronchiseptica]
MSRLVWAATVLACGQALAQPAAPLTGCAAKLDRIETELAQARAHGNTGRIKGLEEALAGARHCDDASLRAERERDVREATDKVAERQRELDEERQEGDPDDIAKAERKLREAKQDLDNARAELSR